MSSGTDLQPIPTSPLRRSEWSPIDNLKRVLWGLCRPLWSMAPTLRPPLLRIFGGRVGHGVQIGDRVAVEIPWNLSVGDKVRIEAGAILYSLGKIQVGDEVVIERGAHLCAGSHDHTDPGFSLLRSPILVGRQCIIGAESFIGPGVVLGDRVFIAPRAVVFKAIASDVSVSGNPAREDAGE
jgi:putative colanic acid biosynthesis acetyltransferase WcaF